MVENSPGNGPSLLERLSLAERARHLRDPEGATGLAVADALEATNRDGNAGAVKDLAVAAGDRVLEIGCGTGRMARVVIEQAEGVTYTGLDSAPVMIEAARDRNADLIGGGAADFHQARAEAMPFADGRFTRVFSIGVIHFWPDPVLALREVRRVMRPGGVMIMGCLGPERAPPFARAEYGFHLRDGESWRSACQAAGFATVDVQNRNLGPEGGPMIIHIRAEA